MIRESLSFNYAGISSESMGITNINIDSGMQSEPFLARRKIGEITVPGRIKPYFQRVEREPLRFQISFAFNDKWDEQSIRAVATWLDKEYYQPLYFSDNPNLIYYALVEEDSTLVHNCLKQGYVTLNIRCDSPYAYSPVYLSPIYPASTFQIINYGDIIVSPEMWITTINSGTVTITNNSDGGKQTIFTNLASAEQVYVNNENETIVSNIPLTYRYSNYNNVPLTLRPGINSITLTGSATIQIQAQWKLLQG